MLKPLDQLVVQSLPMDVQSLDHRFELVLTFRIHQQLGFSASVSSCPIGNMFLTAGGTLSAMSDIIRRCITAPNTAKPMEPPKLRLKVVNDVPTPNML